ncbi:stress responsive A/B Barrel domain-containing protein [Colletotrichum orchidophilum]|uniref:Stress responsive A/B Barrel domain-containing protein n=1 Tax=Colletotrichum orchidophilum TaxID=1209926 RepID=A0A1G4B5Q6_9PEZI|nr:stress responsive A/B Barrel domain-containing protein [Colletotrichum orchidophilum]OHE96615.1 stress responsive A/B Barrel domain-containing protein [Colletotrichum orchidophilum]
MPPGPQSLSSLQKLPLLRLRNPVLTPPPSSSGFGSLCSRTTKTTATRRIPIHDTRQYRRFTNGARLWTSNERRNVLLLGKELGAERYTDEMADRIHRVTMFKIADEGQQQQLIEQYKILGSSHKKDGKPYILSMVVGPAVDDPRTQGFTVVAKTEFASLEDMKYYDDECAAHGVLKTFVKGSLTIGGILSVYFKPEAISVL